ncbi:hypothetical protein M0D21_08135 [Aquimarina sp. D1M17]|uniref:hypothetical protein n=1 Tax=Aquimarina acroporae TaxID=2937283 RepID=UPI0020C00FA8|nr:hypothetical protein [Aquimarina acroporae]MCK8521533.1 hypothetical protein [Aquimarina acroporae]
MKRTQTLLTVIILVIAFTSCTGQDKMKKEPLQSYTTHSPTAHHKVALEVLEASKKWIAEFNQGNTEACIQGYDVNAVMSAMPFGVKKGIKEISEFWMPFITSGATNLIYTNVSVEVANETTAFLSANWSINVGQGIIYQEKWEKKSGTWVLTYDNFHVLEQFKTPKDNPTNPIGSHVALEEMIKASMLWTDGFNTGKSEICGDGYSENASMHPVPFPTVEGKKDIKSFWAKMIEDGATNLTYHNPTFKVITDHSAVLTSLWSMNIGEGKIYQEKWEKKEGKWVLTYDEFEVLQQY